MMLFLRSDDYRKNAALDVEFTRNRPISGKWAGSNYRRLRQNERVHGCSISDSLISSSNDSGRRGEIDLVDGSSAAHLCGSPLPQR